MDRQDAILFVWFSKFSTDASGTAPWSRSFALNDLSCMPVLEPFFAFTVAHSRCGLSLEKTKPISISVLSYAWGWHSCLKRQHQTNTDQRASVETNTSVLEGLCLHSVSCISYAMEDVLWPWDLFSEQSSEVLAINSGMWLWELSMIAKQVWQQDFAVGFW
jgi:hypothetical protein